MKLTKTLATSISVLLLVSCATPTAFETPTIFQIDYAVHLRTIARVIDEETKMPIQRAVVRYDFDINPRAPNHLSSVMGTNSDGWAENDAHHRFGGALRSEFEEVEFLFVVLATCESYESKRFTLTRKIAPNAGLYELDFGTIELRPIAPQSVN